MFPTAVEISYLIAHRYMFTMFLVTVCLLLIIVSTFFFSKRYLQTITEKNWTAGSRWGHNVRVHVWRNKKLKKKRLNIYIIHSHKIMFLIGLTGGIATGKSTVTRILEATGVEVIDADVIARQVVEPEMPAWRKIKDAFGPEVFHVDGTLNREKLGEVRQRDFCFRMSTV